MVFARSFLPFFVGFFGFSAAALAQTPPAPAPAAAPAPATTEAPAPTTAEPASTAAPEAAPAVTAEASSAAAPDAAATTPVAAGEQPVTEPVSTEALPPPEPPKASGPPQLKIDDGNGHSIRFGLLWQAQAEARGNSANDDYTRNLFIRRFALLIGGTVLKDFEYFFDSDFADLFKAPTGEQSLKSGPAIQTKDAFATYRAIDDQLKIDGGLLLPPGTRNFLQGGGALYSWDFFLNTYRFPNAFGNVNNPYGRDVGVQLRGLVLDGLLEYRAGVFQGKRNPPVTGAASRNDFRYAGRLQLHLLDPETGYFYAGTYLGKKRVLSIGAVADYQHGGGESYRAFGGDAFLDLPLGPGGVTAQLNVLHRNGGTRVVIPKQTYVAGEAGYRFDAVKLSPIVRAERRFGSDAAARETDLGAGLAWWAYGHTSNLKAFYTRLIPDSPVKAFNQFNLQWQLFFY